LTETEGWEERRDCCTLSLGASAER
jgi:hypothetical protein